MQTNYAYLPQKDSLVPMAQEMRDIYSQNPIQANIDMIVRLARAWGRYDVWKVVFESIPEVFKAIHRDEIFAAAAHSVNHYLAAKSDDDLSKDDLSKHLQRMMFIIRDFPKAWTYPEIYSEVFRHHGIDHFDNYREFDPPMKAFMNMEEERIPILIKRVWTEGESDMFFTGVYEIDQDGFEPNHLGIVNLQSWTESFITLPKEYKAYLETLDKS